jgi:sialate O-acetylesterase
MKASSLLFSSAFLWCAASPLCAEIKMPHFFGDHMVLQREREASVWGQAEAGATVTLRFKGNQAQAKADASGYWKAAIQTGPADAQGAVLTIEAGRDRLEIQDVLVGEVWFASGQSNMVFRLKSSKGWEEFASKAQYPAFRFFDGPNVTAVDPQRDIEGQWVVCTPETVGSWSAVATYFATRLHQELGVPVGVLESSWGGKPVEAFVSREALNTLPGTKELVDKLWEEEKKFAPEKARAAHEKALEEWTAAEAEAKTKGAKRDPKTRKLKPEPVKSPLLTERNPGVIFNGMIHPFVGYSIRGAIWYQGEGNARYGAVPYDQTLPLLIQDWRTRWQDAFSFYFVQLANYLEPTQEPGVAHAWPLLQDRMRRVLDSTPKTGMAVINDVGEAKDIHPKDKRTVGERLARWALAKDYGRDLVYGSPLLQGSTVEEGSVLVRFAHAGAGLQSRDGGPLKRFEIAGEDRKWVWAQAEIVGKDAVRVRSAEVARPVAVRYAWAANPEGANLVNSEGLPASVFRTDDWPDAEPPAPAGVLRAAQLAEIRELTEKMKGVSPKSEEGKAMKAKVEELLKAYREGMPEPKAATGS